MKKVEALSVRTCEELRIPVPHGSLAAKAWGDQTGSPVLALHGWQDNANTFDKLAPLLPADMYLVCLDFTGHGHSSHLGPGSLYSRMTFVLDIKYTMDYFGWTKFSLLAHSMGASAAMVFAGMFPNKVEKVISLDMIYPGSWARVPRPFIPSPKNMGMCLEIYQKLESREHNPELDITKEEAFQQMTAAYFNSLSEDSVRILMERGTEPCKDEDKDLVHFTRDHRLKLVDYLPNPFEYPEFIDNIVYNYHGEMFMIIGNNSIIRCPEMYRESTLKMYRQNCSHFELHEIDSSHHLHLETPEEVAVHVSRSLKRQEPNKIHARTKL